MLGERIAKLRLEKQMTQEELAKALQISRSALSLYELNKREPDAETLSKIADFFGVTIDYLLGRTDDPTPPEKTVDDEINEIMRELGPDVTLMFYDLKGMSQEEKESLKIFLQGLVARRKQREENNKK